MNPLPFTTFDGIYSAAFGSGLDSLQSGVLQAVAAPALACVTLWIIVQGILIMRGDLDLRRGVTRILKIAIVVSLVTSAANYSTYVQQAFTVTVPAFVKGLTSSLPAGLGIPTTLDTIFDLCQVEFQAIAAEIGPMNDQDSMAFHTAELILYGSLWSVFALYEVAVVMTDVLLAIGPLLLLGYLFDATKSIADRWIGQLITYALLLLMIMTVATIVLAAELAYLTVNLALITLTGPTSAQIVSFYEMDIFLLTGDAFILALPTIAGLLGGGLALQPGEALGRLGQGGFRGASAATYNARLAGAAAAQGSRETS
jgi:type IV secretion system protein VirB6